MFWRFGGYSSASTIDTLLDKPHTTLEDLLDESDLIQELKQHNTKLIEFIRSENNLQRLLEYVVAPRNDIQDEEAEEENEKNDGATQDSGEGSQSNESQESSHGWLRKAKKKPKLQYRTSEEEDAEKEEKMRLKYAYVACEVLSVEIYSIQESILAAGEAFHQFWQFLKLEPPLDPLQAGYFTKVNETLLDRKTEETLDILKAYGGVVQDMLRNVDCPMIMDLLLKIISLGRAEEGQPVIDWLHEQGLMPHLLSFLSPDNPSSTQTSAGDFLKAVITISANASQNEQSCIGPNDLTRQLVSKPCMRDLVDDMLQGGNPLTVGVGIVIEVIRKNNSDYDPEVGAGPEAIPTSRDPIYLGTLLRLFAQSVPSFMEMITKSTIDVPNEDGSKSQKKRELKSASGEVIEPLGFDRFKTCELMAELLHCSNMGLLNEKGSDKLVKERDAERERLRAEGKLVTMIERDPRADYSQEGYYPDQSSSALDTGYPEEPRRLGITNSGDDDGFEDVAVSEVLNDEQPDDFDEKTGSRGPDSRDHIDEKFDEKAFDDDFVDEPLSSPRLEISEEAAIEADIPTISTSSLEKPVDSPTSTELAEQVDSMHVSQSAGASTENTPPEQSSSEPPSSEQKEKPSDSQLSAASPSSRLSPHPDDEPPPLFAGRSETQPTSSIPEIAETSASTEASETVTPNEEPLEVDEDETIRSLLLKRHYEAMRPYVEMDHDGSPVIGDYLKMMFVEYRVVPTILEFFFRFPWNNFLHNVVYDVVQQVFNGPMDRGYNRSLAIDLFETGMITERIVEGQRRNDKAQLETNTRLGYMGHLTLVAEEVVKFTERHPPEFLSKTVLDKVMHADWIDFVERTLAETRERDNAILGGVRPDMSNGPRQAVINSLNAAQGYGGGASAALANAGLTGGNNLDSLDLTNGVNASSGGFNLGGNSLLSGFGDNSDDEDEEDEFEEDHEDEALRAQAHDQFAATGGSFPNDTEAGEEEDSGRIPNIPPPPPPLNIGPSRARRQLQTRLAAKARQEEEERARLATGDQGPFEEDMDDDEDFGDPVSGPEPGTSPFGFGEDDAWGLTSHHDAEAQEPGMHVSPDSSMDDSSSDDDSIDLPLPTTRDSGVTSSSAKPRRPSTTEATQRSALEGDSDDEDEGQSRQRVQQDSKTENESHSEVKPSEPTSKTSSD